MDDMNRQSEREEGAGMARHYKLGLAVIGSLLITLVVVAVVKLRGGPEERAVASEPNKHGAEAGMNQSRVSDSAKAWQANKPRSGELNKPTPVPPKPVASSPLGGTPPSNWSAPSQSKPPRRASGNSDSVEVSLLPSLGEGRGASASVIPPPPAAPMPEKRPTKGGPRHGASPYPGVQSMASVDPSSNGQHAGNSTNASNPWGAGPPAYGSPPSSNLTHSSTTPGQTASSSAYPPGYGGSNPPGRYHADGPSRGVSVSDDRLAAGSGYQPTDPSPRVGRPYQSPSYDYSNPDERASVGQYDSSRDAGRHRPRSFDARAARSARREDGKYFVQPNDSFWTISESLYGTGSYFRALAEWNRETVADQNRLRVGDALEAPAPSELEKRYPDLCPSPKRNQVMRERMSAVSTGARYHGGPTYTVREGDTLYDIARYKLGAGARWTEIYDLNRDVLQGDFDYLTPGMKLALPDDSSAPDAVTRRPGSSSRW